MYLNSDYSEPGNISLQRGVSFLEVVLLAHSFKTEYYMVSHLQNFCFWLKLYWTLELREEGKETFKNQNL